MLLIPFCTLCHKKVKKLAPSMFVDKEAIFCQQCTDKLAEYMSSHKFCNDCGQKVLVINPLLRKGWCSKCSDWVELTRNSTRWNPLCDICSDRIDERNSHLVSPSLLAHNKKYRDYVRQRLLNTDSVFIGGVE